MARNGISYEGRLVDTERMPVNFGRSRSGGSVISFTIAESHQTKNKNAAPKYQQAEKTPEDWVDTTTTWHKVTAFGETAEALALDTNFNHGAVIEVIGANYTEEDPWLTRDNVYRAGRPETIPNDDEYHVGVKALPDGRILGPRPENIKTRWDGDPDTRPAYSGGGGGGASSAPELVIGDDDGF